MNSVPLREVLMISKPMIPPWDDSAKNIVRSQLMHSSKYAYRILTPASAKSMPMPGEFAELGSRLSLDPTYRGRGDYSPGIAENARVFLRGLRRGNASIYHYFFAPNPMTSAAGRIQKTVARVKTVQTVCSTPRDFRHGKRLLFTDLVIVLSEHTRTQLEAAGVDPGRIRRVRPGIEPLSKPDNGQKIKAKLENGLDPDKRIVLFPGDYEFSSAAETVARAAPLIARSFHDVLVVFACRMKGRDSIEIQERLRKRLILDGYGDRVKFLGRVENMPALVGSSDVVLMPSESLYGKMDVPLVLLEAMAQEVPLILADAPPLDELLSMGVGVGIAHGDAQAVAEATRKLLSRPIMAAEMGHLGAEAARNVFSVSAMARGIETIYDEVLEL